jgi:sec-independent protein translocase protein TatC
VPYILWEIWRFIKPALLDKETQSSAAVLCFMHRSLVYNLGILFGYYVIAPESISFLAGYTVSATIHNQFTISSYLSMVATITLHHRYSVFELAYLDLYPRFHRYIIRHLHAPHTPILGN